MRIKVPRYYGNLDFWVLVFSLVLVRLPVALGFRQSPVARLVFLLPLIIVSAKNLIFTLYKPRIRFNKPLLLLFLIYSLFLVIAFIRTAMNGAFPASTVFGNLFVWIIQAIFAFTLFVSVQDEETKKIYRRGIFYAFSLYLTLNFLLYLAGFRSPVEYYSVEYRASLLGSMGIATNRALFPTAGGFNTFGTIAGVTLITSTVIFLSRSSKRMDRLSAICGICSGFAILLLTDSRGALAFIALAIMGVLFLPKRNYGVFRWLPVLTPLFPIALVLGLRFLPVTIATSLSRNGSDLANMSNRLGIWNNILNNLATFSPYHLIGYGYRGQVISGLSETYSNFFASYTTNDTATAHNFLLQSVLETGYLGTFFLILLLFLLIGKLVIGYRGSYHDYTPKAMLFVIVYLILMGTTESVLSPDFQEIFTAFLLIWAATGTLSYLPVSVPSKKLELGINENLIAERT